MRSRKQLCKKIAVGLMGILLSASALPETQLSHAFAVNGSTPIRVAISIKNNHYDNSYDTVNLIGRTGNLSIGFMTPNGFKSAYTHESATTPLRGSLDDFYVVVGEAAAWTDAQAIAKKLADNGYSYSIIMENRQSKPVYQVVQGYYETIQQAQAIASKMSSLGLKGSTAGWYRLVTGAYPTWQAAKAQVDSLRNQSIDSYVAARQTPDGANSYEVWLGNAATAAERDQYKATLASKGVQASPVDFKNNYVLFKTDVTDVGSDGKPLDSPHIFMESTKQETVIQPLGNPSVVRVQEKSLTYRGSMILRGYNQRLAVVNLVALDDYLKGVVPIEMATGWPLEALKAQAVAARSYVMVQPENKWSIARVDDSTYEQAYRGYTWEQDDTSLAVDQTHGQVLMYNNGTPNDTSDDVIVQTFFSASHGGKSADSTEVWGSKVPYLVPVDSHWDSISAERWPYWYKVMLPSGMIGYVVSDLVSVGTDKNTVGLSYATVNGANVNVRILPDAVNGKIIGSVGQGQRLVVLDKVREYDDFAWMEGPFSPTEIKDILNRNMSSSNNPFTNPIYSLYVSQMGPSGRVLQVTASGTPVKVSSGIANSYLFGLMSDKFDIEQQGTYTVMGANGRTSQFPDTKNAGVTLHMISGSQQAATPAINGTNSSFVVWDGSGHNRVVTKEQSYIIHGAGNGHGLGLSQWGARGMAQEGYKFDAILRQYYTSNTYLSPLQ